MFDNRRPSLDGVQPRSPPVIQHRRSFNPLWRSATSTVPEERPQSSLSFLSETSTVRPLSTLPTAASTATIIALKHERKASVDTSSKAESPSTTRLRQRHLPSLSLTLLPSATGCAPPRSPGPSFPALSPRMMQRAHSENPYDTSHSPIRCHYFTTTSRATSSTHSGTSPSSKGTSIAETPPAQRFSRLEELDGSGMLVRRVSLSDLKIPQRISNAQAKIGQDLKRVKEFKEGVEGKAMDEITLDYSRSVPI